MNSTTQDKFQEDVIEKSVSKVVLVDVWAEWCSPCKAQLPILQQVSEDEAFTQSAEVVKLDADTNMDLIGELGVRSIPTLIWFVDGQEYRRETGLKSKKDLLEITRGLANHL